MTWCLSFNIDQNFFCELPIVHRRLMDLAFTLCIAEVLSDRGRRKFQLKRTTKDCTLAIVASPNWVGQSSVPEESIKSP
ncbi:hypothetical protein Plhal304r1_c014g0051301 [Plasmopara halstedii]